MNDLSVRLVNDVSGFNSSMESATSKVQEFKKETDKAGESIEELGDSSKRSAKDLISEISKFSGAERSVNNYKRKLGQMTRDIQDLTINYKAMSREMQNSELGRETLEKINELTLKAGEYKDAILDAQAAIKAVASDTAAWDAAKQGIDTLSAGLEIFVSTGVLGKKSTEDLVQVLAQLKGIEAATNAVIKIGNALQKQSALMMGVSRVQSLALAAAKKMETASTVAATVAQKAFNVVAKANPYVFLASVAIAAGTAIAGFVKHNKKNKEEAEKAQKALEKEKEAMEHFADTVGSPAGTVMAKFNQLGEAYRGLSTKMEKTQFIKDNQKAFEDLGISISSLGDADNVFINNTAAFERAIMQRARAAALYNLIVENFQAYAKEIEKINKMEAPFKAGQIVDENRAGMLGHRQDYWTLGSSDRHMGTAYVQLNESGAELLNEEWRQRQRDAAEKALLGANSDLQKEITEANSAFNAILSQYGIRASGGSGTGKGGQGGIEAQVGSLAAAQAKVTELQTVLNNMSPDNAAFEQTKQKLAEARAEVERIQKLLKDPDIDKGFEGVVGSLDEANYYVSLFTKQLQGMKPGDDEFQRILSLLNEWKQKQKEITDTINGTQNAAQGVLDIYRELSSQKGVIQEQFNLGLITPQEAQAAIDELNNKLGELGIKVPFELEFDDKKIKTISDKMRDFTDSMKTVGSLSDGVTAINSVYESISNLGDKLEEAENGWESFMAVFEVANTIFQATAQIIETVATVTEILTSVKQAAAAATNTETAATLGQAAANTTEAATAGTAAAAEAGKSVASIPYLGPILAIAAIASVLAVIFAAVSKAKGFAEGGIVGGHSYTGDKILARLNSNEMILTTDQQNKLWGMMNSPSPYGNVEFVVKGDNLVGVFKNIQKKNNRV